MVNETLPMGNSHTGDNVQPSDQPPNMIKELLIVLILSIVGCFFICTVVQIYPSWIDYFPLVVLVGIWWMYSLSSNHVNEFNKPAEYLVPVFVSMSASFLAISLVFSLHGNAFDSYEQASDTNNNGKWFKIKEMVKFPIDQLMSRPVPQPAVIDFAKLKDPTPSHDIIIVDKTRSNINPDKKVQQSIFAQISHQARLDGNRQTGSYNVSTLLPANIFCGLAENKKKSNANDDITVYYYNGKIIRESGKSELLQIYTSDIISPGKLKGAVDDYLDRSDKFKNWEDSVTLTENGKQAPSTTSFKAIFNSLKDYITHEDNFKNGEINIFIISDFLNTDAKEFVPEISDFPEIKRVVLYQMDGKEVSSESEPSRSSATQLIEKLTNKFSELHWKTIVNLRDVIPPTHIDTVNISKR